MKLEAGKAYKCKNGDVFTIFTKEQAINYFFNDLPKRGFIASILWTDFIGIGMLNDDWNPFTEDGKPWDNPLTINDKDYEDLTIVEELV